MSTVWATFKHLALLALLIRMLTKRAPSPARNALVVTFLQLVPPLVRPTFCLVCFHVTLIFLACSTNDYHFEYTKCVNGIRSKTAVWTQSALCNPLAAGSATLPAASNEPCTISCKPGQIVQDNACAYCPNGQKLDNGACVACAPGTAASNKIYHVDQFSASDLSLNTTCFGDCYSDGWRYAQTYAESGMGGKDMDSWYVVKLICNKYKVTYRCSNGWSFEWQYYRLRWICHELFGRHIWHLFQLYETRHIPMWWLLLVEYLYQGHIYCANCFPHWHVLRSFALPQAWQHF